MRLDFLVPGFAKCGTTTLCALLREHPEIFMPERKDYRLFDLPTYERRWEAFEGRFRGSEHTPCIGEASVWYTDSTTEAVARGRILEHFPDIKLIFVARDPIDRIESSFREMHHSAGRTYGIGCPRDLTTALQALPGMVTDSSYGARFDNYRAHMDGGRCLVVFLEELVARPEEHLRRCFEFLGVDPDVKIPDIRRRLNRGSEKLYDADRLQEMRKDPRLHAALGRIPRSVADQLLRNLDLRRPFGDGPLEWTDDARDYVLDRLGADVQRFLAREQRPLELWPRFASAVAQWKSRAA